VATWGYNLDKVEVKKPFLLATLAILLAGLVPLGLSDTSISIADTVVPAGEGTNSLGKASNS
jgi:hypothetical protein